MHKMWRSDGIRKKKTRNSDIIIPNLSGDSSEVETDELINDAIEVKIYPHSKDKISETGFEAPRNIDTASILYKDENIEKLLERNCFGKLPVLLDTMVLDDRDSDSNDGNSYIKAKKKRIRKRKSKNPKNPIGPKDIASQPLMNDSGNQILNSSAKQKFKTTTKTSRHILPEGCNNMILSDNIVHKTMKISCLPATSDSKIAKQNMNKCHPGLAGISDSHNMTLDKTSDSSQDSDASQDDKSENIKYVNLALTSKGYVLHGEEKQNVDILALQNHFLFHNKPELKSGAIKPILYEMSSSSKSRRERKKKSSSSPVINDEIVFSNLKENVNSNVIPTKTSVRRPRKQKGNLRRLKTAVEEEVVFFEDYYSADDVTIGLQLKEMIEGYVRINAKNHLFAYVCHPNPAMKDIEVDGVRNRNRALEGDLVVILLLDSSDSERQKGKVVFIKEHNHSRICVGNLKYNHENNQAYFIPKDKKIPRMFIPLTDCPQFFSREFTKYANVLYLAKIILWTHVTFITGTIVQTIGPANSLNSQNKSIMLENGLDAEPYGDDIKEYLPLDDFVIPEKELLYREDFRNECVFTIDPQSARDLDDAVSCKILNNGNYEIGVHISDVTYYLQECTLLDEQVAAKATTVYLVDETYHMLPKQLCLHCSLLPNCDKLSFSVLWEITKEGDILNHRFTRSIINSCCQLSYEHVTRILESQSSDLKEDQFPSVKNSWSLDNVSEIVHHLNQLAVIFRKKRFENGALKINQKKLSFQLDPANRDPVSFYPEEHNESHQLIEEFMLLANCTVAARIFEDFPDLAFLRSHPPPKEKIHSVLDLFGSLGIDLDVTSAGELQASLVKLTSDDSSGMKSLVLDAHLIKTLSRAKYFCSDGCDDDDSHHYALNIPIYTHFTSPIRRYADIVVHRLLSASLKYSTTVEWTSEYVKNTAKKCNDKKYSAKNAGDSSSDVFLMKYISNNCPVVEQAVVMDIHEFSLELIIISMGLTRRVFFDKFSTGSKPEPNINKIQATDSPTKLIVTWPAGKQFEETIQTIEIFSVVSIQLDKTSQLFTFTTRLLRPTKE